MGDRLLIIIVLSFFLLLLDPLLGWLRLLGGNNKWCWAELLGQTSNELNKRWCDDTDWWLLERIEWRTLIVAAEDQACQPAAFWLTAARLPWVCRNITLTCLLAAVRHSASQSVRKERRQLRLLYVVQLWVVRDLLQFLWNEKPGSPPYTSPPQKHFPVNYSRFAYNSWEREWLYCRSKSWTKECFKLKHREVKV